jgi:uncharacterized protein (DUF302 family)
MTHELRETPFTGVRVHAASDKPFDDLVAALFDDIGSTPVPIDEYGATYRDWDSYAAAVQNRVGSSGFMLFATLDHGNWIGLTGIQRKALRVMLGNPLIAITMIRHDVTAGLFAPVELLVLEEPDGRSSVTYVKPSSLMVVAPNPPLLAAAEELDRKLAALVAKIA